MLLRIFILFIGVFNKYSTGSSHLKFSLDNIPAEIKSISCSGGISSCTNNQTCCQLESGQYGCCSFPNGICCNDHLNCCPHGYTCNEKHSRCEKINDVDDGISYINGETCCELKNSSYDFCPYRRVASYPDKIYCCGEGYSYDESGSKCVQYLSLTPLTTFEEQICPDGKTKCSTSSTCCPNKNNNEISYSCCPYNRGVCCGSNGSSCCPNKYMCDEENLTCQLDEINSSVNTDFRQPKPFAGDCEVGGGPMNMVPSNDIKPQACNLTQCWCVKRKCCYPNEICLGSGLCVSA